MLWAPSNPTVRLRTSRQWYSAFHLRCGDLNQKPSILELSYSLYCNVPYLPHWQKDFIFFWKVLCFGCFSVQWRMPDYHAILSAYLSGSASSASSGYPSRGASERPLSLSDALLLQQHLQESNASARAPSNLPTTNNANPFPTAIPAHVDPVPLLARQLLLERNNELMTLETLRRQAFAASLAPGLVQNQSSSSLQHLLCPSQDMDQALRLLGAERSFSGMELSSPLLLAAMRTSSSTDHQSSAILQSSGQSSEPTPAVQVHNKPQTSSIQTAQSSSPQVSSLPTPPVAAAAAPEAPTAAAASSVHVRVQSFREASDKIMVEQMLKRKTKREQFPERLHRVLCELEEAGDSDIVSFVKDGTAFAIHKPESFESQVIPRYFRQQGLSSFRKQLRLYGFTRLRTDSGALRGSLIFHHALFQKNKPELCVLMNRVGKKGAPHQGTSIGQQS